MPLMKVFDSKQKALVIGSVNTAEAAINGYQINVCGLSKRCRPRGLMRLGQHDCQFILTGILFPA